MELKSVNHRIKSDAIYKAKKVMFGAVSINVDTDSFMNFSKMNDKVNVLQWYLQRVMMENIQWN